MSQPTTAAATPASPAAPPDAHRDIFRKRLRHGLTAGLVGLAAAWLLSLTGITDAFEARSFDWRARLLAPKTSATDAVRLILLDQASLDWGAKENGLSWPWPREVYGFILDFCRRGGAAGVAFDVLYTEPSAYGVADDTALAEAGQRLDKLALAVFLGRETGEDTTWPAAMPAPSLAVAGLNPWLAGLPPDVAPVYPKAAFPVPEVAAGAKILGNVSQEPDPDGIYRRVSLFGVFDGRPVPSLSLAAFMLRHPGVSLDVAPGVLHLGKATIPLDPWGRVIPRWRASSAFPAVSAAAVIQSELALRDGGTPALDPEIFRDRFVLFGFSAPGLLDMRPSPVAGVTSGVEIHAQTLESLLSGDFVRDTLPRVDWVVTAVLALVSGLAVSLATGAMAGAACVILLVPLPGLLAVAAYALGLWLPLALPETAVAASLATAVLIGYATEGRQKRFIKTAFRQYLSPAVIEQLIANPDRMALGGELRELTIFFSDLQGFTSISEGLGPQELTAFLNTYLTAMTDIILEEGGTVDKYEGDAIIAFWNAPLDQPDHATRAVRTALRCQRKLAEMRPLFDTMVHREVIMRVGLNTGPAVVGNMGSNSRFDYTMLGDAVNLASRLEGINKQFGTQTMISQATRDAMGETIAARTLARVAVVGRAEPVVVSEPLWPEEAAERAEMLAVYAKALDAFIAGHFAKALELFCQIDKIDPAAASYVVRCRDCLAVPPVAWKGVCVMTSK
ncbi:CHASE2 domain-containing protein [Desulfovibrio aerotolerans]|uniref:CHASE2 domain-containing protein n=1 Tax=Solidesulfovibrio aerotolerans TaxID=295255 RepID=A0A7C9MIS1_9BACT|nr:adenylate/guanylate cyclase domain-containing protein [Solidesulfovibrio aerotolerans]MYL81613.1 CHASE2 domain-containing protein [Solidesulfovibrio aerotolerans]